MSRSYVSMYEMEKEIRRKLYLNSISESTKKHYNRYLEEYNKLKEKGYDGYIPEEMQQLGEDLKLIRDELHSDPEFANNVSKRVGNYIWSIKSLGEAAIKEFEYSEKLRITKLKEEKEKNKNELMNIYYELVGEIKDPVIINYSINDLQNLKNEISSGTINEKNKIKSAINDIKVKAKESSKQWKKEIVSKNKENEIKTKIEEVEKYVKEEKIENKIAKEEFINKLNKLKEIDSNVENKFEKIDEQINSIQNDIQQELVNEDVRKKAVIAIIKQLRTQEFIVEKPKLFKEGSKDYVKITARKPSGKTAVCNLDSTGKIAYKFDQYDGMTCLKDIEKFNIDLEKIYSIKLSDERVLWENPDKISKDADTIPKNKGGEV